MTIEDSCHGAPGHLIFVVGASRTGTTLMSTILGRHTEVLGTRELHFFGDLWQPGISPEVVSRDAAVDLASRLFARERGEIWSDGVQQVDRQHALELVGAASSVNVPDLFSRFCQAIAKNAGKLRSAEQTPRNVFYVGDILRSFPQARIIEMVRDPRAVLYSQKNRWRMRKLGANKVPWSEVIRVFFNYHPMTMTRLWKRAVAAGDHFSTDSRVMRVRYEDLAAKPELTVQHICNFLDLSFEASMLKVSRIASSTTANTEKSTGVGRDSVDLWRSSLAPLDRLVCESMAAADIERLGYDKPLSQGQFQRWKAVLLAGLWFPLHAVSVFVVNPRRSLVMLRALWK